MPVFWDFPVVRGICPFPKSRLVRKRHQYDFLTVPRAFYNARALVGRQQPPLVPIHDAHEPLLVSVVGGPIGDRQLRDCVDSHLIELTVSTATCRMLFSLPGRGGLAARPATCTRARCAVSIFRRRSSSIRRPRAAPVLRGWQCNAPGSDAPGTEIPFARA